MVPGLTSLPSKLLSCPGLSSTHQLQQGSSKFHITTVDSRPSLPSSHSAKQQHTVSAAPHALCSPTASQFLWCVASHPSTCASEEPCTVLHRLLKAAPPVGLANGVLGRCAGLVLLAGSHPLALHVGNTSGTPSASACTDMHINKGT